MPAPRKPQTQPRSRGTAKRLDTSVAVTGMPTGVAQQKRMPPLPPLPGGIEYLALTLQLWEHLWDEVQAAQLAGAQIAPAYRWIRAFDEWQRAIDEVALKPLVQGSKGQPVTNPLMMWVTSREVEMEKCERQLGIGLRNKADLGISLGQARLTAQQVNQMTTHQQGSASAEHQAAGEEGAGKEGHEEDGWTAYQP